MLVIELLLVLLLLYQSSEFFDCFSLRTKRFCNLFAGSSAQHKGMRKKARKRIFIIEKRVEGRRVKREIKIKIKKKIEEEEGECQ